MTETMYKGNVEPAFCVPDCVGKLSPAEPGMWFARNKDMLKHEDQGFIRGVLPILIIDWKKKPFRIGMWVAVNKTDYSNIHDRYNSDDDINQARLGPVFGHLANALPFYPLTLKLETKVVFSTRPDKRPSFWILPIHETHPLYIDQQSGITLARLQEIMRAF